MIKRSFQSTLRNLARRTTALLLISTMTVQPIAAQSGQIIADPNSQAGLSVQTAPNGVPLVDINRPNAQGLSHNQYSQFDVGASGAILNNQAGAFSTTELGGVVQGNENLAGGSGARVILNEVVSTQRSELSGTVEVAGQSADVIIANPNGITCNGCGFIRTPRVVLTTGSPEVEAGQLTGFRVTAGDIRFGANGADLGSVNLFDVVSRQIMVEGSVQAGGEARLVTGANHFDYATGEVTLLPGDHGSAPDYAIDSTAFGGLYAGRIGLLANEQGVGVRAPAEMAAHAGQMTLTADGRLVLGRAQAQGPVTVRSQSGAVEIEKALFSDDAISLTGQSARLSDDATLAAGGDLTLEVSAALTLGKGALLAAGMTGEDGSLQGDGALSLVAEALLASDAGLAAAGNAEISANRIQLDQSGAQAALTVHGAVSLTSNEISASNAQLTVGGDLALNATGDLTLTDGDYRSGGGLSVAAESLTSSADFTVSGSAEVETRSGPMTLSGDLKAEGQVALSAAGNLGLSGGLASGDTIRLSATGALTSSGTVVAERDLSISAASITNSGAVGSSAANLSLQSPGDILNSGLFYAGQDITLALDGTLENSSADIIAEGGIRIQGLSDTRAAAVQNRSANIEAITGSLMIAAAHLANEQPMPTILTEVVSVTSRSGSPGDFPNISHPSRTYSVTQTTTTTRQVIDETTNSPARMRAGGDIQINADSIVNQYSQIAANGDVTLTANSITNSGQDLLETVTVRTVSHYKRSYCKRRVGPWCLKTGTKYLSHSNTRVHTATVGAVFASIQAGGALNATATGYVMNEAVRGGVGQIGLSSGSRALSMPPQIGAVNPNAILGRSALFVPTGSPNAPFLIETRAEFIDVSRFLSSDYFLNRIGGYDPNLAMRRFGDAYVEARLIQEQFFALTGRPFGSDPEVLRGLMQSLYDNAIDATQALQLTPGVALSPEQIATLTETIIWLEPQVINGEQVLVPVVYLAGADLSEPALASAQLVAAEVSITADNVTNSGRIAGNQQVQVVADSDILNIGGQIESEGSVTLKAEGSLANVSGQISGEAVQIEAGELENSRAVLRDQTSNGFSDRLQDEGSITASGNLTVEVKGDITAEGGSFAAGEDASLKAGGDITIGAVTVEQQSEERFKGGYSSSYSLDNELASVTAGGNLSVEASEDLTIAGAEISAEGDATLSATGDVEIRSVQNVRQSASSFKTKTGGLLGVKTSQREQSSAVTTEDTRITTGGSLTIRSGEGDIRLIAPEIESGGETKILAEQGDIALLTNADSAFESFERNEEDLLWQSAEGSGFSETTRTPTRITAEGGLQILAGGQVIAEYVPTGGDFEAGIEQLAQSPGLAWMAELQELDNVAWQEAQVAFEDWDYESQGLTEAGALLVSTVASFATSGLTSGLASSISQGLGISNAGMQAAIQAGLNNLVSTASVSLVNNQGDLGAVLDELGSSENLRSLVSSMVSAGLSSQLTEAMGTGAALPGGGSLMDKTLAGLQADLVQTSVSVVVDTAIQGGDLSENLVAGWSNAMVMAGLGAVQERIGDFAAENDIPEGTLPHVLAHAVAGGFAAQALGEDFADGALGASIAAFAGPLVGETELSAGKQAELQNLIAMTATLLASDGDAGAASVVGSIARSLDLNNRQLHTKEIEALKDYAESLDGVDGKTSAEWLSELTLQAMRGVDRQLSTQIEDNPEAQAHLDVLIAQYGETFTNGLGGVMGFLDEDNERLFNNSFANAGLILDNREFYDAALADWAPDMMEGLQGYVTPSDLLLLDAVALLDYAPDKLMPEELAEVLPSDIRQDVGTLQMMVLLEESARIYQRVSAVRDEVFDSGDADTIMSWLEAYERAEGLIEDGSNTVRNRIASGVVRGVTKEVAAGLGSLMLFGIDSVRAANSASPLSDLPLPGSLALQGVEFIAPAVGLGTTDDAIARNQERLTAFVYLVRNLDQLPANVQQGIVERAQQMNQAVSEGRLDDAGEILGEFYVFAGSAATGLAGSSTVAATALRQVGRLGSHGAKIDVPTAGSGSGTGVNSAINGMPIQASNGALVRPPNSPNYSVATEVQLPTSAYPGISRQRHNQISNQALHEAFEADPSYALQMENLYPGIVDGVKPGSLGAFPRSAPTPDVTWHHGTQPGQMQLVPIDQHRAPGSVQESLHPNSSGGFADWGTK